MEKPKLLTGLFSFAFILLAFLLIGQALAFFVGQLFGVNLSNLAYITDSPDNRAGLLMGQFIYAFAVFVAAPWVHIRYTRIGQAFIWADFSAEWKARPNAQALLLALLATLAFLPCSGYLVEWNEGWQLSAEMEAAFKQMQEELDALTQYMLDFDSGWQYLAGLLVIAVLPAIGEELAFRGVLQKYSIGIFGNVHVGVWATALIFSAFHLQIYGLVPRMVLGAMLGYLYVWSGKLYYPMLVHFINNGLTLTLIYLYKRQGVGINIEQVEISGAMAVSSLAVTGALLYLFRKQTATNIHH